MSDATAAMLPAITLIASGSAYLALIVLAVICVFAISIVHNRLEEMRFVELLATSTARGQPKPTLLHLFSSVTILDVFLGMLTGLLATFVMKSGSNILSKTSLGTVDVSNPYGVAFVASIAGLFMDKFYSWLEPLLATGK